MSNGCVIGCLLAEFFPHCGYIELWKLGQPSNFKFKLHLGVFVDVRYVDLEIVTFELEWNASHTILPTVADCWLNLARLSISSDVDMLL